MLFRVFPEGKFYDYRRIEFIAHLNIFLLVSAV